MFNFYRKKVINTLVWQLLNSGIDFYQKSFTCIEKKTCKNCVYKVNVNDRYG